MIDLLQVQSGNHRLQELIKQMYIRVKGPRSFPFAPNIPTYTVSALPSTNTSTRPTWPTNSSHTLDNYACDHAQHAPPLPTVNRNTQQATRRGDVHTNTSIAPYITSAVNVGGASPYGYHSPRQPQSSTQQQVLYPEYQHGQSIQCACLKKQVEANMVQCTDPSCRVWQHVRCVSLEHMTPQTFLCESCRVYLADPFWQPIERIVPVVQLKEKVGSNVMRDSQGAIMSQQTTLKSFYLTPAQHALIKDKSGDATLEHRVHAACLLVEDEVPVRVHWPRNAVLRVNSVNYRVYSRSMTSKMGINQRDAPANISDMCLKGRNTFDLSCVESGNWLISLQIEKRRSLDDVKLLMLPEESLGQSLERLHNFMRGGATGDNTDARIDDDDSILIAHQVMSLKDPITNTRMTIPARFVDASELQPFDLDTFLSLAQSSRKWQDPMTLKNSTIRSLQVDGYAKRVLEYVKGYPQVSAVEIDDQGRWRPEGSLMGEMWFDIHEMPEKQKFETWLLQGMAGEEADTGNGGDGDNRDPGGGQGEDANSIDVLGEDSNTDEEEELRQAAAAVRSQPGVLTGIVGQKRKEQEVEVIDLLDSDSTEGQCNDKDDGAESVPIANARHTTLIQRRGGLLRYARRSVGGRGSRQPGPDPVIVPPPPPPPPAPPAVGEPLSSQRRLSQASLSAVEEERRLMEELPNIAEWIDDDDWAGL